MEKLRAEARTTLLVGAAVTVIGGYTILWISLCAALLHGRPVQWTSVVLAAGLCLAGAMSFGRTLRRPA